MSETQAPLDGPDFTQGVPFSEFADGAVVLGHAAGEPVLLARRGSEFFAIGAVCTHYGGPLAEGLLVGDTVRCPWHHACFSLRTGDALRAPALNPVSCWRVEQQADTLYVRERRERPAHPRRAAAAGAPQLGRHPGRRRGRQCLRGNAPQRGLCRPHYDAERR